MVALQLQVHSLAELSKPVWISGSTPEVGQILFLWGSLSVLEWIWDWCWSDGLDLCASITSAPFFTHTDTHTALKLYKRLSTDCVVFLFLIFAEICITLTVSLVNTDVIKILRITLNWKNSSSINAFVTVQFVASKLFSSFLDEVKLLYLAIRLYLFCSFRWNHK